MSGDSENVRRSKVVLGLITVASLGRPKSFTNLRSPWLRGDSRSVAQPTVPTVVVLIDGDHIGPPWFEAIFEAGHGRTIFGYGPKLRYQETQNMGRCQPENRIHFGAIRLESNLEST